MKKYTKQIVLTLSVVILLVAAYAFQQGKINSATATTRTTGTEHLTKDSFKEKICDCAFNPNVDRITWKYKGDVPAVIDFYAEWCGPCRMISPILEELSVEYKGRLKIYKVNTEEQRELAGMFGIRSIPSILFIPVDGQPTMAAGALPKQEFRKIFREVLKVKDPV